MPEWGGLAGRTGCTEASVAYEEQRFLILLQVPGAQISQEANVESPFPNAGNDSRPSATPHAQARSDAAWVSEAPHRASPRARTPVVSPVTSAGEAATAPRKRDAERSAVTKGEHAPSLPERPASRTAGAGDERVRGPGSGAAGARHGPA